jgi:hypothetical protein
MDQVSSELHARHFEHAVAEATTTKATPTATDR